MEFPVNNILPLIPQKESFVMVGELLFADDSTTKTSFTIEAGNVLINGDKFSEAGLMENIAQTAAGAGYMAIKNGKGVTNGYIGTVKNFEIFEVPKVGQKLKTEVIIENRVMHITVISGRIFCEDKLMAQCEMNVYSSEI
jgi:hypothetical protein